MAIKIKFYENVWIIRALMSQIKWPGTSHRARALLFALFVRCPSVCLCAAVHAIKLWKGTLKRMLFAGNVLNSRFRMFRIDFKGEFKRRYFPDHLIIFFTSAFICTHFLMSQYCHWANSSSRLWVGL